MKPSSALLATCVLLAAPAVAMAERAYVQSFGEVDLAPFQCEAVPHSANVRKICYDARRQYALVSLSGVWYRYCGVPGTTMSEWKRSLSKGRYYNDRIRGSYDCTGSAVDQPIREPAAKASTPGQPAR